MQTDPHSSIYIYGKVLNLYSITLQQKDWMSESLSNSSKLSAKGIACYSDGKIPAVVSKQQQNTNFNIESLVQTTKCFANVIKCVNLSPKMRTHRGRMHFNKEDQTVNNTTARNLLT